MKFNADSFKAAMVKAAADMPQHGASDGIVCAVATIRIIRAGLIDDVGADQPEAQAIKDGLNELIAQLTSKDKSIRPKLAGFASNASAAAAAAGLKVDKAAALAALTE